MSCIKSIQRGNSDIAAGASVTIDIEEVDVSKSVVIISGGPVYYYNNLGLTIATPYLTNFKSGSFTVTTFSYQVGTSYAGGLNGNLHWLVIEFA